MTALGESGVSITISEGVLVICETLGTFGVGVCLRWKVSKERQTPSTMTEVIIRGECVSRLRVVTGYLSIYFADTDSYEAYYHEEERQYELCEIQGQHDDEAEEDEL